MKKFQVLDRHLSLHQHYLLEASAGTGKTFSIQNIVVRLLIETNGKEEPLPLHKILVVTFTRAATRDLKIRIRSNIEEALEYLRRWQTNRSPHPLAPDYLIACMELGEEPVQHACKRLQQALFTFDRAQIFTIHSFCARMLRQFALESDIGLHSLADDEPLAQSEISEIIYDFFRTEVRTERYSVSQLEILLKTDPHQRKLLKLIQGNYLFPSYPSFQNICDQLNEKWTLLKGNFSLISEKMLEDFTLQAKSYRNYSDESKAKSLLKISRFVKLFDQEKLSHDDVDQLISDGLVWVKALHPSLLKGKAPRKEELHYPSLTEMLSIHLAPLIEEAGDSAILLARMAGDCQKLLQRYQLEEEKLSHDDVLKKMDSALLQPSFLYKVQDSYQAAIVDEFQDTDPLQWQIFRRLFISHESPWKGYLYLVGDPKQSIYSFRQADIYTYLAAVQALGEQRCFSLDVNYRSEPRLVEALNTLFHPDHLSQFIPLPKKSLHLLYQPVQAGQKQSTTPLDEERGAVHFFIADSQCFEKPKLDTLESHIFFPFIGQEILRLRKERNLKLSQFAILVRDRHQSLRLAEYLDSIGIASINQRGTSLVGSPAHLAITDLLRALLHPQDRAIARTLLGGILLRWDHIQITEEGAMEFALLFIRRLRASLLENGFASCFQQMLASPCKPNGNTIIDEILSSEGGLQLYRDLQQIADIIVDHQHIEWNSPEGIIHFLDHFYTWEENEDTRIRRFQDPNNEGVKILTLHFSKGLEFDIVFALGVVNRMGIKDELIPTEEEGALIHIPVKEGSESYVRYCEECDAEKMRQLYVAWTRAKTALYIPVALHLPSEKLNIGDASPIDLFLSRLRQPHATTYEQLYEQIRTYSGKPLIEFLETIGKDHFITFSIHQELKVESAYETEKTVYPPLHIPDKVIVSAPSLLMTSFTTLSQHTMGKKERRQSFISSPPHDYEETDKNVHTLPADSETGLLLHSILENIDFATFNTFQSYEEAQPLIHPFIQRTPFEPWAEVVARMVFNALKAPLIQSQDTFNLSDISSERLYREMPFVFPYETGNPIEGLVLEHGLIKGVIDCFFYHNGFYYLLDWKTNWLGPAYESYTIDNLEVAMQDNAYNLQASIYTEALSRYLSVVESRPFEECFGGVFYLFMRGIQIGKQTGIHHNNPLFMMKI